MATLSTTNIKHASSGSNNIVLAADGSTTISNLSNAGKIIQVKQTVKTNRTTIQSQTLTDITGLSVSITPSSASNKILVNYSVMVFSNAMYYAMRLVRNSDSTIFIGDQNPSATSQLRASFGSYDSSYVIADTIAQSFLDSPNTTSATTYKLQAYSPYSSAYTIGINSGVALDNYTYMNNCVSTITAMEVAA